MVRAEKGRMHGDWLYVRGGERQSSKKREGPINGGFWAVGNGPGVP
jgi:hypothetical protein